MTQFFSPYFRYLCLGLRAARDQHDKLLEIIDDGYRLDKFRAAVWDKRYRMTPPVWSDLDVNPNHKAHAARGGAGGAQEGGAPDQAQEVQRQVRNYLARLRPQPGRQQLPDGCLPYGRLQRQHNAKPVAGAVPGRPRRTALQQALPLVVGSLVGRGLVLYCVVRAAYAIVATGRVPDFVLVQRGRFLMSLFSRSLCLLFVSSFSTFVRPFGLVLGCGRFLRGCSS